MCKADDEYCWAEVTCQICRQKLQGSFLRRKINQVPRHYVDGEECFGIGLEVETIIFLAPTFMEYAKREGRLVRAPLGEE